MFMNEEFTSKNIKNNEPSQSKEEFDYKNLITKLEEIKNTIALLEKATFK
ncbi:hypothetical protein OA561_00305 [bacterium]|nr:hypothetical protein [bacterium]